MKTKLFLTLLLSLVFYLLSSQIPEGFNYQAIARDGSGEILANKDMLVIIELRANSESGTLLWQESHAVTSDQFGLISLVVGKGMHTGGLPAFTDIDWSAQTVFLKTTVEYPLGTPHVMGATQIWSVPYSLVAKDVEGPVQKLGIEGTTTNDEEALFEVRNKSGQLVFAVYNEGIRAYVNEIDAKGAKGGFAIGSFGTTKEDEEPQDLFFVSGDSVRVYIDNADVDPVKGPKGGFAIGGFGAVKGLNQKYFMVSNDSVRIYIDNADSDKGPKGGFAIGGYGAAKGKPQDLLTVSNDSVRIYIDKAEIDKGPKGGFAIGGYGTTKALEEEYLRVTRDSTRIYVNNNPAKGVKGGFAIGGFGETKGSATPFTSLTDENYFIGHRSGIRNTTGIHNSYIGYEAGQGNTTGRKNVFLGYHSGYLNDTASYNVFIGNEAGLNNKFGRFNSFLGFQAGYSNQTGSNNVAVGNVAGYGGSAGSSNVFIGDSAGYGNTSSFNVFLGKGSGKVNTAQYNSFMGYQAGFKNTSGGSNVFIGNQAGYNNSTGEFNVSVGYKAGFTASTSYNTFVGYQAGYSNSTGQQNVFLGYNAGFSNTQAWSNVFLGTNSGYSNRSGSANVFIGEHTGYSNLYGYRNVFIGWYAGEKNTGEISGIGGCVNVFIGTESGRNNLTGYSNVFIGNAAGKGNTSGKENVMIGKNTGEANNGDWNTFVGTEVGAKQQSGTANTFLGYRAGFENLIGNGNTFVGSHSGAYSTGYYNSFFGSASGYESTTGNVNAFFGVDAGRNNKTGSENTFIGMSAGFSNNKGMDNTFVGYYSGYSNASTDGIIGSGNTYIGMYSGRYNTTGVRNIFLGFCAGRDEMGSEKLYIENSWSATPLIYGEFNNDILTFHAKVGIGTKTPSQSLEIAGTDSKIYLNSASSNMILYNVSGSAVPAFNTRSVGTKLVLNPQLAASSVDYAFGVENNAIWYSVPQAVNTFSHKFYAGTTEVMRIRGDSRVGINTADPAYTLDVGGSIRAADKFISTANGAAFLQGGDDTELRDVNNANTLAIYGIQNSDRATLRLGSNSADISGYNGNIGIGTTTPAYKLDVAGSANIRDLFILESETINVSTTTGFIVTPSKSNVILTASAASILNVTTPIANGTSVGQLLILRGSDNTNTITINDSGNVNLAGPRLLEYQDVLTLMWDGTSWIQMAFASNSP